MNGTIELVEFRAREFPGLVIRIDRSAWASMDKPSTFALTLSRLDVEAEDSSRWLTRREACERIAKTLWSSTSKADVRRGGDMLDRACLREHVKDNGRKGPEKKIDPTTLGNWLNSQRDRELDIEDDEGDEDDIAARIEEARRKKALD